MIIGNPIMACTGASAPAASIFVTGLSETDTVTATKGAKTLTGKWTQKPNPNYIGLPDGYTQLEYIESTGTQYIETNVALSNTVECWLDFQLTSTNDLQVLLGADQKGNGTIQYMVVCDGPSNGLRFTISSTFGRPESNADLNRHSLGMNWNGRYLYDDSDLGEAGVYSGLTNITVALCRSNYRGGLYASMKTFAFKIKKNSYLVRDFVPCKRNSDNVVGLYDVVNDVFYTNAGTGEFVAGSEVPQTIDGHMLSPIRELGTWTVTATDGTNTDYQDVLVDVITEYYIEMSKKLYLYREGDECEDVTGGWISSNQNYLTIQKNNDSMLITRPYDKISYYNLAKTSNIINFDGYTKIGIEWEGLTTDSSFYPHFASPSYKDESGYRVSIAPQTDTSGEVVLDIPSLSEDCVVGIGVNNTASSWTSGDKSVNIKRIWLE